MLPASHFPARNGAAVLDFAEESGRYEGTDDPGAWRYHLQSLDGLAASTFPSWISTTVGVLGDADDRRMPESFIGGDSGNCCYTRHDLI